MIKYLEQEGLKIKELIESTACNIKLEDKIIYDGIANIDNYASTIIKVLFLLKESYDTNGTYKWQVGKIYNHKIIRKFPTLRRIGYIIHGIRNNSSYDLVKNTKNILLANSIESSAWVNINKIAAKSHSEKDLTKKYNIWKDVIIQQIKTYNPDIIVCGNTLQYLKNDLGVMNIEKKQNLISHFNKSVYISGGRLIIQTIHPGSRLNRQNEKLYVDSIIQIVKEYGNIRNLTSASTG